MLLAAIAIGVAVAACGSGSPQNANAPSGRFPVRVSAAFPALQRLAQRTHLVITVRNVGSKPIPNVAVTICNVTCTYPAPPGEGTSVAAFSQCVGPPGAACLQSAASQGVANRSRPVWVVDRPPGVCAYSCIEGGAGADVSAASNTWQRGRPLRPGGTTTFNWGVTAVAPGHFVVAWEVAGDIYGNAKAVVAYGTTPCGKIPCGTLPVTIAQTPAQSYVNDTGQIVTTK
jgi:hypothetical protein